MERVLCNKHGNVCALKTGVKEGPSKDKSFYVCIDTHGCDFTQVASVPVSHCLHHEDSIVELQALTYHQQQQRHRLYYRCVVGKKAGQKWCGNVPWTAPEKERRNPLFDRQLQPSCLPPVRNPFKAPGKTEQDSEWRRMQCGGSKEKGGERGGEEDRQKGRRDVGKESDGNADAEGKSVEEEERAKSSPSDSYRGKQLPPGMKVKKRLSDEERTDLKADGEKNMADEMKDKTNRRERRDVEKECVKFPPTGQARETSRNAPGDLPQQPAGAVKPTEVCSGKKADSEEKNGVSDPAASTTKPHSSHTRQHQDKPRPDHPQITQDKAKGSTVATVFGEFSDDDDDVQLVSVTPGTQSTPPVAPVQKTLTAFPGFQLVPQVKGQQQDPTGLHRLYSDQLKQKKATLSMVNVSALPDKGERLRTQVKELEDALDSLSLSAASQPESQGAAGGHSKPAPASSQMNPFSRQGGTILLPAPPAQAHLQHQASGSSLGLPLSQGHSQAYGASAQVQAFYGGRMTNDRLLAVKNATSDAIEHLHGSLESCPDPDAEASDPKGIKVLLLPHQRRALAWLLWRETQKPCGGILADDMGLGKTLTMIALILAQKKKKKKAKEEDEETEEDKKPESWISKTDSSLVVSKGTLIICPASLIHHWEKEVDRHVKKGLLSVYLYHGPNRQKSARLLADHDVVVTTYSLVSKEIPAKKEDAEHPSKDLDDVPSSSAPLLRVSWARVVLDEAHNIKNPKVQTSMAVCRLRARARWAVTGTPIQNNLLDMYSLLKFLRCSPFDEYKLWKAQVDNGSKRGGERLNLLTKSLLLRRTKDQTDSTGKPLVPLPERSCEVHRLQLSEDEQAVYDVVFAQSRSTLQNYLKRHEGNDPNKENASTSNPFSKVAQEFSMSQSDPGASPSQKPQQASSTVHILSLLLRLRQCCCHPSLLRKTLEQSELQGDGVVLSLEEQLSALSLGPSPSGPDLKDTVCLNGSRFSSRLFEDASESSKICAIVSELKAIRQKSDDQKSVIVSQWTSMLKIMAVHLRRMGLSYGVIDGTVNPKRRMDLVEEFNTDPEGPQVMLVSLCAGGVGLNLIGGNHLFLMDMHWNPALEAQACDRIYRVGQRKDVTIHRFVCNGTVEDKISILQEKKKELAQKVLSGTGSSVTKLSLADLKVIFGL
ncbi:transcription termination factor 2 [Polymixia lowei]